MNINHVTRNDESLTIRLMPYILIYAHINDNRNQLPEGVVKVLPRTWFILNLVNTVLELGHFVSLFYKPWTAITN